MMQDHSGWAETDRLIQVLRESLRSFGEELQIKKLARRDAPQASVQVQPKQTKSPYWASSAESYKPNQAWGSVFQADVDPVSRALGSLAGQGAQLGQVFTENTTHDCHHRPSTIVEQDVLNDVGPKFLAPPAALSLSNTHLSPQELTTDGHLVQPLLPPDTVFSHDVADQLPSDTTFKSRSPVKSPFFCPEEPRPSPKTRRPVAGTVSAIPFPPLTAPCFSLIQENLSQDPFWLLIAVTFLIKTAGKLAIPAFYKVKERFPTPEHLAASEATAEITDMIRHLGLAVHRTSMIQKYARSWVETPPQPGVVYRVRGYDRREVPGELPLDATTPTDNREAGDAWEIGHMTQGKYALDSWRIFCRDELLGRAQDWNGLGAPPEFQPEWMRVRPDDKELRACLRWMYMKEGWEWDPTTGEKTVLRPEMERAVNESRVEYDDAGGLRILDRPRDLT
ncbi:methyl-CpG binding domain-containing protein 4 [Verticillium dahliae]